MIGPLSFPSADAAVSYDQSLAFFPVSVPTSLQTLRERYLDCALAGLTVKDTAEHCGVTVSSVYTFARTVWAREHNIRFRPSKRGRKKLLQHEQASIMARRYVAGETLKTIGDSYGSTRERVRQLITKYHGLTAANGGHAVQCAMKRAAKRAELQRICQEKYGCTLEQRDWLLRMGRSIRQAGGEMPTYAYSQWRKNVEGVIGSTCELKLWDWWQIWQQSGLWDKRGRAGGAWMQRIDTSKGFTKDNVVITGKGQRGWQAQVL